MNDWPIRLLPTGFPSTVDDRAVGLVAQAGNLGDQPDEQRVGDAEDHGEHQQRAQRGPVLANEVGELHVRTSREELDDEVDEFDADERGDDAAEAVDVEVAAQQLRRAARGVAHTAQRQRDQRDDDDRVEDDRRQDRRLRAVQPHDVQQVQAGEQRHEHRRDDREVLRDVVGDRERGQRAAGDQQLLADLDDLDELGRVGVEVDHVAGLFGRRRAGVHRHADVGLGQRGRVVGAVAGHRDELAALLLAA